MKRKDSTFSKYTILWLIAGYFLLWAVAFAWLAGFLRFLQPLRYIKFSFIAEINFGFPNKCLNFGQRTRYIICLESTTAYRIDNYVSAKLISMKLLYYYLQILLPVALMVYLYDCALYETTLISILIYVLIYRPLVDGHRLIRLRQLPKKDLWKMFIPFYGAKYFGALYFGVLT